MPSRSPAQARLMRAAAHDPAIAAKTGVPVKVAREFVAADTKTGGQFNLPRTKRKPKGG